MVSILTVPEQKSNSTVTVALTPDDTRGWLERLSLPDSERSLTRIYHELHDLNRVPARPGLRLRLLELYRAPVRVIADNIEAELVDKDIPLPRAQAVLAELCKQVFIEMAYGYKRVVLDLASSIRSARSNKDLRTAIHRSIHYLTQTVFHSGLYYKSQPPGTWIEIHSLYGYGRKLNMLEKPVKDALNRSKPRNTVAHVYQQAILFGVSDVFRLSAQVTTKLRRYLDRWSSLVELKSFDTAPTSRCQFVIDPEQDHPARPFDEEAGQKRKKTMLLLDARAITNIAHSHWHEMRTGSVPKSNGLGDGFFDGFGFDMLEQVIRAWGIAPRRKFPRNPISGPFQLVLGIEACVFCVNGERAFTGAVVRGDPGTPPASGGAVGTAQPGADEVPEIQNWAGLNESTRGACLSVDISRPFNVLIRIGEIVAYRTNRRNARWLAGLVRWVRITDTELRAGIQQLGVNCRPAAISPIAAAEDRGNGFKRGMFVPPDADTRRLPSLVAPAGTYRSERKLMVDDGKITKIARAGKLLERSAHYDWFEFELIDS